MLYFFFPENQNISQPTPEPDDGLTQSNWFDLGVMLNMPKEKLTLDAGLKDRVLKELIDCHVDQDLKELLFTAVTTKEIVVDDHHLQPKPMAFINHGRDQEE